MVRVVVVDGLIGVGKTTVLETLQARGHTVLFEPVGRWAHFLRLFYAAQARWSFTLQMQILLDLTEALEAQLQGATGDGTVFVERCAESAEVFVRMAERSGKLTPEESALYRRFAARFGRGCRATGRVVVYLTAPAQTCLDRVRARGRKGEERLDVDYLLGIKRLYEEVVVPKSAAVVDVAGKTPDGVADAILRATTF